MRPTILMAISILLGLASVVMTYSCFEIQEKKFMVLAQSIEDAIQMIDDNIHFEHKEE